MADYTQITSFAPKDALTTGNPAKKIRGAEIDPEFAAISAAVQTKFDSSDIAANAEASALTGDSKLITPGKLAYALQNGSLTLGAAILLSGGIAATDVARKSVDNTFAGAQVISNTAPKFGLNETDASADARRWDIVVNSGAFIIRAVNDADSVVFNGLTFNRGAGATIATATISAASVLINGATAWHAANDGSASGLDADLLDGLHRVEAVSPNTVPSRDGSSDLFTRYFNSSAPNGENPTVGQIMVTNGSDGYIRKATLSHLQTQLGLQVMSSGVYSPTLGSTGGSISVSNAMYQRQADIVFVNMTLLVSRTVVNGDTYVYTVTLPVASDFIAVSDVSGSIREDRFEDAAALGATRVRADIAGNRVELLLQAGSTSWAGQWALQFAYRIR
jgi:hypothetical protein